ncbi:MAG: hypothetical protein AB1430_21735 [Pseudomonadota bacterium]
MSADRLAELQRRREALQLQAADQRRAFGREVSALHHGFDPLRRVMRWASTALLVWRLWRRLGRHKR